MEYTKKTKILTAKRLKSLREEKGRSHQNVSDEIAEKYGTKKARSGRSSEEEAETSLISKNTLIQYEISDEYSENFKKGFGMSLKNLCILADYYNVSVEYLLGFIDSKTIQEDIKQAHITTGLSEDSILNLKKVSNFGPKIRDLLDYTLSNNDFLTLLIEVNILRNAHLNASKYNEYREQLSPEERIKQLEEKVSQSKREIISRQDNSTYPGITLDPNQYENFVRNELIKKIDKFLGNLISNYYEDTSKGRD